MLLQHEAQLKRLPHYQQLSPDGLLGQPGDPLGGDLQ